MAIFRHTAELPPEARGAVVAIGNFDGVHRGHQAVLAEVGRIAARLGAPRAVLTFEPHPRRFFRPHDPPFQLTSFRLKARLLEALGVDHVFFLTFNEALSRLSAEAFVRDILVRDLGVRHVVVGGNFAFGHKRRGDPAFLRALGEELGFGVTVLERVIGPTGEVYSSSAVRRYLTAGDPTRAALLLGRYWEIEGRVQAGARLGRKLGFPTANIDLDDFLVPAFGVYAVRAGIDRGERTVWHPGVANLGVRPMVESDGRPLLEVHLFDFEADLYGQHMRTALVDYLRPEMTFSDLEAMRARMAEDARRARVILAGEVWQAGWPASPFLTPSSGPAVPEAPE
ncbi:MAG: bifunctional riboflavin kinase/FAD synthetase [Alphaproteobacteria bacterium]|nr:MAG: bifunctional riboflavin kinase/FAD synthetase [Alphaproteobacteria bacterium]